MTPEDRRALVNVLVYHWRTATSGCGCGWHELGASHPEHVADVVSRTAPWWSDHRNLALTAAFMFRQGGSEEDVLYMLERPEKHNDDFNLAQAQQDLPGDLQEQ